MILRVRVGRPTNIFYGWWVVATSSAMALLATGILFRGFAVFFIPLRDSLRLTNFQTSLVFSISRAEGGLEGPIVGWLIDRFGTRKLMLGGILLSSLGFLVFSQVNSYLGFIVVYLGLISLGSSVAFQHALFSSLNMWFIRHRALAMSINGAFASLGGVILVPILSVVILNYSWQTASLISGAIYLFLILPLSLIIRPSPESMGLLPDGDHPQEGRLYQSSSTTQGASSRFPEAYASGTRASSA